MTLTSPRLRKLVNHREQVERLQELDLAAAQRRRLARLEALEGSRARRRSLLDTGPGRGTIDVASLEASSLYLVTLDREIAALRSALAHSDAEVEQERGQLLERRRDRRAVETLLERQLEEERVRQNRAEAKRIDELAAQHWWAAAQSSAGQGGEA